MAVVGGAGGAATQANAHHRASGGGGVTIEVGGVLGRGRRLHGRPGVRHKGVHRGGAGRARDVGHRIEGRAVRGGEGGVGGVACGVAHRPGGARVFGRGPEVGIAIGGGVPGVRHRQHSRVSVGEAGAAAELAGGVERGLAVALGQGPGPGQSLVSAIGSRVLGADQVLGE